MHRGVAVYLGELDGLTYSEGAGGNVFVDHIPESPDRLAAVISQPSTEADSKLPYDPVEFQVVVRCEAGSEWALDTAKAVYSRLHGKRNITLPDGTYAVFIVAQQGALPFRLGEDDNGRPAYSVDFRGEQLNQTEERP